MKYPDNADGDVLRRIERSGSDMNAPMRVDFLSYASNSDDAISASQIGTRKGYKSSVEYDKELGEWTIIMSVIMIPSYSDIIFRQNDISEFLSDLGICCEEWGSTGNSNIK